MAQLIDIRKVAIGPRFLTARIRIDEDAPLFTNEDPEGTARVLDLLPEVADHACLGDAGPLFGDAVDATEVAHLFEHVTIELMARTGLAGNITSGRTKACVDEDRAYEVRVLCPDDVLAAGALSSAAFVLDWAYSGGSDPKPAIEAIVSGLVSIVESVSQAAPAPAPQDEPAPEPMRAEVPVAQPEALEEDLVEEEPQLGATVMMEALPSQPVVAEPTPEPVVEPEPAPRRSTLVMVAGPGVDAYVADPDPAPSPAEPVEQDPFPQPIMVAGPKRG